MVTLSHAKAHLSEVVRATQTRGEDTVITVDGVPAARIVPLAPTPRPLTDAEIATVRALMASLRRIDRPRDVFDAVELVTEGRR